MIVADDGRCRNTFDQLCVPGSDPAEGWAALDLPRPWLEVRHGGRGMGDGDLIDSRGSREDGLFEKHECSAEIVKQRFPGGADLSVVHSGGGGGETTTVEIKKHVGVSGEGWNL